MTTHAGHCGRERGELGGACASMRGGDREEAGGDSA
eukprot:CAMPEP_0185363796 /NCGR_PEP_ID=MMETSP1364-20130426/11967_1 /TAXON_ID=38817 /ORGANISM="Gephyrocapsa oceanica, Strain RCC1303" /LENGTH=35 /DNA_ID= /DNA_START= /DNA_END= /DNA_ORIENTATION=